MEKNSEIGIHGRQTDKKRINIFYICILSVQLYSDDDVLPKRSKAGTTCLYLKKAFAPPKHGPKKNPFQILI